MNIFDVILPITIFFSGLYLLQNSDIVHEDHLKVMNLKTANLLESLVLTKYFRIIRLNIN